jgi:hypothetical protein
MRAGYLDKRLRQAQFSAVPLSGRSRDRRKVCFSATASFTTAAVTAVIGVIAVSRTSQPREFMLAGMPIMFAIQQGIEGLLWLNLPARCGRSRRDMFDACLPAVGGSALADLCAVDDAAGRAKPDASTAHAAVARCWCRCRDLPSLGCLLGSPCGADTLWTYRLCHGAPVPLCHRVRLSRCNVLATAVVDTSRRDHPWVHPADWVYRGLHSLLELVRVGLVLLRGSCEWRDSFPFRAGPQVSARNGCIAVSRWRQLTV